MENPAVQQSEITASLSKAEQIKLQSLEDKVSHYDPQNPFLAIIGADTDRLIDVFAAHIESIFKGEKKRIPYIAPFDIAAIAYEAGGKLLIVELPAAAAKDKVQIAENFLFYRDVVLERNMKMIVLCHTEIFNELHLKAMDFVSMSLETNQFMDFKAAKEDDLKESDTLAAAEKELQEKIDDLERYKKEGAQNSNLLFEKINDVINAALTISETDIALRFSFEMHNYSRDLNNPFFEMNAMMRIGHAYFHKGLTSQSSVFINEAIKKSVEFPKWDGKSYLINSLGNIYSTIGKNDQAIKKYNEALKLAQSQSDTATVVMILANLSTALYSIGDYTQALYTYQRVHNKFKEAIRTKKLVEPSLIAQIYTGLGTIHSDKGEVNQALRYFHQSLSLSIKNNMQRDITESLIAIGVILKETGSYLDAIEYFNRAKNISITTNNVKHQMDSLYWIASVYIYLGKPDEAEVYLNRVKELDQDVDSAIMKNNLYESYGDIAYERKQYEDSIHNYQEGHKFSTEMNFKRGCIESNIRIARVLTALKDYKAAKEKIDEALESSRKFGLMPLVAPALGILADILLAEGDIKGALDKSLEALSISRKILSLPEQVKNLLRIYILYSRKNDTGTALRYLNEAKSIASAMDNRDKLAKDIAEAEKKADEGHSVVG
jgi:tetratricopeptide (TPR) repeat protein